jgi:competence protein ComEA
MEISRQSQYVLALIILAFTFGSGIIYGGWRVKQHTPEPVIIERKEEASSEATPVEPEMEITVHVAGAVQNPGVYSFRGKPRVEDAVRKAVPLPEADLDALNLASSLKDEQKIYVPRMGEEVTVEQRTDFSSQGEGGKVNINTAGTDELNRLPGIGPVLADRIVEYREEHGPFTSLESLKNVPGIGEKKFKDLESRITY